MFDLKNLAEAKTKVTEIRQENSLSYYDEALKILENFENGDYLIDPEDPELGQDITKLQEAGEKLAETIQFDPENECAYIALSYIFYILEDDQMALKYINMAESVSQEDLPDEILEFKQKIMENI
jgi:tetratricopeptide (TPR) repeat protein